LVLTNQYTDINSKIIEKIQNLSKDKNIIFAILDIIQYEIRNETDSEQEFKSRYKSIIEKYFPFSESK